MKISIQLLDFNKKNSSEEFLKNLTPTDSDKQTYKNLVERHEDYFEDKFEDNDMFSFLQLDFEFDVERMSSFSIDPKTYNKAIDDCGLFNSYDCIALTKTNAQSFEFLLNMFDDWGWNVSFIDENFEAQDIHDIKELIKKKQEKLLPVVFNHLYYTT